MADEELRDQLIQQLHAGLHDVWVRPSDYDQLRKLYNTQSQLVEDLVTVHDRCGHTHAWSGWERTDDLWHRHCTLENCKWQQMQNERPAEVIDPFPSRPPVTVSITWVPDGHEDERRTARHQQAIAESLWEKRKHIDHESMTIHIDDRIWGGEELGPWST